MDFDTLKIQLDNLKNKLNIIKEAMSLSQKKDRIVELEKIVSEEGFWEDSKKSAKVLSEMKILKSCIEKIDKLTMSLEEAYGYLEIAEELNEIESFKEAGLIADSLNEKLDKLEIDTLLSEEYDSNNAIITIHPGAGGTESQDWALMLYRMYTKWCNKSEFDIEVLDYKMVMRQV